MWHVFSLAPSSHGCWQVSIIIRPLSKKVRGEISLPPLLSHLSLFYHSLLLNLSLFHCFPSFSFCLSICVSLSCTLTHTHTHTHTHTLSLSFSYTHTHTHTHTLTYSLPFQPLIFRR